MNILVITSIAKHITPILQQIIKQANNNECKVLIVGDKKTGDLNSFGARFFNEQSQADLNFSILENLPWNSYSRKNLGYLEAMRAGAEWIIETDDDNIPSSDFFKISKNSQIQVREVINQEWVNVYRYFGNEIAWPRGFPLECIHGSRRKEIKTKDLALKDLGVIQVIADNDPDVDAIFRLTQVIPQTFSNDLPLKLPKGAVCPFNSQATWWNVNFAELMYFPSNISWRVADIWRSYIATRILQEFSSCVVFFGPLVVQDRNDHNLLLDFKEEITCYLEAKNIWEYLKTLDLSAHSSSLSETLFFVYSKLANQGFLPHTELLILRNWIKDVSTIREKVS